MSATSLDDPVLQRFRRAASEAYGSRIERVVLFGSRARQNAHDDANYDVAAFFNDPGELWDEVESSRASTESPVGQSRAVVPGNCQVWPTCPCHRRRLRQPQRPEATFARAAYPADLARCSRPERAERRA